jgi:hypothetical protein
MASAWATGQPAPGPGLRPSPARPLLHGQPAWSGGDDAGPEAGPMSPPVPAAWAASGSMGTPMRAPLAARPAVRPARRLRPLRPPCFWGGFARGRLGASGVVWESAAPPHPRRHRRMRGRHPPPPRALLFPTVRSTRVLSTLEPCGPPVGAETSATWSGRKMLVSGRRSPATRVSEDQVDAGHVAPASTTRVFTHGNTFHRPGSTRPSRRSGPVLVDGGLPASADTATWPRSWYHGALVPMDESG